MIREILRFLSKEPLKTMDALREWLNDPQFRQQATDLGMRLLVFCGVLVLAWIAGVVTRRILLRVLEQIVKRTKTAWDDALHERKVFSRLSYLVPALVLYGAAPLAFEGYETLAGGVQLAAEIFMILIGLLAVDGFLTALVDICRPYEFYRRMPVRGFVQVVKILLYVITAIIVVPTLVGKSPTVLLGGMGAMTAVLILVFKDTILGFVAGIQLSTNQMVCIGDWIEMPKFGADGDVIDITLTTVKVSNWDKTITTIPTYALISDAFKNWRGMQESGGRRIKRAIYIDMTSVKFCTKAMVEKYKKIHCLKDYIEQKEIELAEYNAARQVDDSVLVNGRRMTNLGTFRAYIAAYLHGHPKVHQHMTFLIRHLAPTAQGLPIEIYVFSNDQVWANYEAIQADIFDHMLAVIPEFDLRVFQNPTGADLQRLTFSP